MKNFFEKYISEFCLIASIILIAGIFGIYHYFHSSSFGASVPQIPAQFETSLSIPQATTDTSMTLASATLGNGATLSGYYCFTVDTNTALNEYECGTASTTSPTLITNITRGIDPQYGTSSVPSLIYSHRVGADVRITDFPVLSQVSNILNGQQGMTQPIIYSGVSTSTISANPNNLVDYASLQGVTAAGTVNATTTLNGIIQFATPLQTAASVSQGSTGAFLVAQNSIFASSSSSTTLVPVTQTNGKLNPNFLDQTANYNWTGFATSATTTILGLFTATNATSTLAATTSKPLILDGVSYFFPPIQGSASSTWLNNGSGVITSVTPFSYLASTSTTINTSWTGNVTATLAQITATVPTSERLEIFGIVPNLNNASANVGLSCNLSLVIDGAGTTTVASVVQGTFSTFTPNYPANFSYITGQIAAGSHTFILSGTGSNSNSNACGITFTQMSIFNAGN